MKQYFYYDGINQHGPFSFEEMKGKPLTLETQVWYQGLPDWTALKFVSELRELIPEKIVPPPINKTSSETNSQTKSSQNNQTNYSQPIYTENKKNKYLVPGIIGIVFLLLVIIAVISKNNNQDESISDVKDQVSEQANAFSSQNDEEERKAQERQAEKDRINAQLTEKYMGYRNNWRNYISAGSNQYQYSELGGISGLEVIVSNQTDKRVDEVQVRIDYVKANGGKFKSETVSVTNIAPNSSKSVTAPNSERGTSVNMEIENISASSFHFCYPYGNSGNDTDPYFCK